MVSWSILATKGGELTLKEQQQERNHEHQKDRIDAPLNPVKHRHKLITSALIRDELSLRVESAYLQLVVERTQEDHCSFFPKKK